MPERPLAELVLDELRALRRHPGGVTVDTLALAPVICRLLGSGDPYLAYTRLQHGLIDATADRTLRAAAASLGFSTTGDTHLERLDEAGDELGLDQRQVRRLSDQGLTALAALISTNWTIEAVPELTAVVTSTPDGFMIAVVASRPQVVEMSEPDIDLLTGDVRETPHLDWRSSTTGEIEQLQASPIAVPQGAVETSLMIIWRGELWPKFTVHWHGDISNVTTETLGNKLMLRLVPRLEA